MAIREPARPQPMVGMRNDAPEMLRGGVAVQVSRSGQGETTEQRVADKNEPSDLGEQNECGPAKNLLLFPMFAYLFLLLLFSFPFSFFLLSKLGLLLLLPFSLIFTAFITHIWFSVIEDGCSVRLA